MYSLGLYCDDCFSNYVMQAVSPSPGPQECVVCGSLLTEVVDYGIDRAWRTEILASGAEPEAELIDAIRAVFGPDVEELDPDGRPMAASIAA